MRRRTFFSRARTCASRDSGNPVELIANARERVAADSIRDHGFHANIRANISAGLAHDRDINTRRDHFQVHFKSGVMTHQNPAEMSAAPNGELLCVPWAPSRRCAFIFLRVTYLSILRRTIGFNEAEIENTTVRAARGSCRVNQRRRMSGTISPLHIA